MSDERRPLPSHADVIIIGGGLPGIYAAYQLASQGVDCMLLEARSTLGDGASGRAPGLLHTGLVEHPWRLVAALGQEDAAALYRFGAEGLAHLASVVPVQRRGVVWAAVDEREVAELEKSHHAWVAMGIASERWDPEQVCEALGGAHFGPGIFRPDEGVFIPSGAIAALSRAAESAGAKLYTGTRVTGVQSTADGVQVDVSEQSVQAEIILFAAEAGLHDLDLWFEDKIHPVREQALRIEGGPSFDVGLRAGFGYTTAVHDGAGLTLAGCRWASPHMEVGESDDTITTPAIQERLSATAKRFFPAHDSDAVTRRAWITGHTCDGLPIVGPMPGAPRMVVCAGFGGNEACLGVRAAHAVVDGIMHGTAQGVPERFGLQRFL